MLVAHLSGSAPRLHADHTEAIASKKTKQQGVEGCSGKKDPVVLYGAFGVFLKRRKRLREGETGNDSRERRRFIRSGEG